MAWSQHDADPIMDFDMEKYNFEQIYRNTKIQLMAPKGVSRDPRLSRSPRIEFWGQPVGWIQRATMFVDPVMRGYTWCCDVYGVRGHFHRTLPAAMEAFLLHTKLCHPERMNPYALRA